MKKYSFAGKMVSRKLSVFTAVLVLICFSSAASEIAPAFLWTNSVTVSPNSGERAAGVDIALDNADNCYISGFFYGTADFGPTNLNNPTAAGNFPFEANLFIAKYDGAGRFLWVRQIAAFQISFFGSLVFEDKNNKAKQLTKIKPNEARKRNEGD